MNSIEQLDPDWAWQPFEAGRERRWGPRLAAHLYRRAGFGADRETLEQAGQRSPHEAVDVLLAANRESSEFRAVADALASTLLATGDPMKLSAAWVYRLLFTPAQLLEKATLFWHGHFATGAEKVNSAKMMWRQNELIRRHALGDFAALAEGIAKDPAMLVYLDSASNRKSHPNENFARELMELFCLGEGHYSERDVLELARCFTGWEVRRERFRKNPYQHDQGVKTILGQRGNFDGERAVRLVIEQEQMPRFLCRKLYRYFISDEPEPPERLIAPLAKTFRDNGLQIDAVLRQLFSSNLFFSEHAVARKVRSPVELVIGTMRGLRATSDSDLLARGLRQIGQGLFYPPNVKGWDGGRAWINSSTLLGRANLFERVLSHEETRFDQGSLADYLASQGVSDLPGALDHFETCLMAVPLAADVRERLLEGVSESAAQMDAQYRLLLHATVSLPQFQIG